MSWRRRLSNKRGLERQLDAELQLHIELQTRDHMKAGMPEEEARRRALLDFGGLEPIREECRDARATRWAEDLIQDLRYGLRSLFKTPVFAATAIATLALGIGATTAVFSIVDLILFRDLPYAGDDRLVSVGIEVSGPGAFLGSRQEFLFGGMYLQWRERQKAFESLTSWSGTSDPFGGDFPAGCDLTEGRPVRLTCAFVASNFLPTLGVAPLLGRNFTPAEDLAGAPRVALLAYRAWQARFGGDPGVVDRTISLNGQPVRVIGVLPKSFELPTLDEFDLLVPQAFPEAQWQRLDSGLQVWAFARLRPGGSLAQARAQMQTLFKEVVDAAPPNFRNDIRLVVRSLRERQVGDVRYASWLLLGSVLLVLLTACANVANLLLARGVSRQRELAVRAALGAGRPRLIRQSFAESLLLGLAGCTAGLGIAAALLRVFQSIAPQGITRLTQAHIDLRVLVFTLAASFAATLLFGGAPAMRVRNAGLPAGSRVIGGRGLVSHSLIAGQIAVSILLLFGAGLLLRTLWNLQGLPLGVDASNLTTFTVILGDEKYPNPVLRNAFFDRLERRLAETPELTDFAISDSVPLATVSRSNPLSSLQPEGRPKMMDSAGGKVVFRVITPGYFSTFRIPILAGRAFEEQDRRGAEVAIVISQTLARRLFGPDDPLGQRIRFGGQGAAYRVIGVADDARNAPVFEDNSPEYYLVRRPPAPGAIPQFHAYGRSASVTARSAMPLRSLTELVHAARVN